MTNGKHAEIVRAAMDLFSEKGYSGTSMRDIADAVGLQPGSLYAHISGKEELLAGIIDLATEQFHSAVAEALEDSSLPVAERLRRLVEAHVRIIAENKSSATVFLHEWRSLEGKRKAEVRRRRDEYQKVVVELLAEGVQRGEFRPLDTHLAAVTVLSIVNWTYTWYSPSGTLSVEKVADEFTNQLVHGFAGKPAAIEGDGRKRTARKPRSRTAAK